MTTLFYSCGQTPMRLQIFRLDLALFSGIDKKMHAKSREIWEARSTARLSFGEVDDKRSALTEFGRDRYLATVQERQVFDYRQPQTRAAQVA